MPQHHQNHPPHAIGILLNSLLRKLEAILMQRKAFKTVFNHVCCMSVLIVTRYHVLKVCNLGPKSHLCKLL